MRDAWDRGNGMNRREMLIGAAGAAFAGKLGGFIIPRKETLTRFDLPPREGALLWAVLLGYPTSTASGHKLTMDLEQLAHERGFQWCGATYAADDFSKILVRKAMPIAAARREVNTLLIDGDEETGLFRGMRGVKAIWIEVPESAVSWTKPEDWSS